MQRIERGDTSTPLLLYLRFLLLDTFLQKHRRAASAFSAPRPRLAAAHPDDPTLPICVLTVCFTRHQLTHLASVLVCFPPISLLWLVPGLFLFLFLSCLLTCSPAFRRSRQPVTAVPQLPQQHHCQLRLHRQITTNLTSTLRWMLPLPKVAEHTTTRRPERLQLSTAAASPSLCYTALIFARYLALSLPHLAQTPQQPWLPCPCR